MTAIDLTGTGIETVDGTFCPHCEEEIDPHSLPNLYECSRCGNQEVFEDGERGRCSSCNVFMAREGKACPECQEEIEDGEEVEATKYRTADGVMHDTEEEAQEWIDNYADRTAQNEAVAEQLRTEAEARHQERLQAAQRAYDAYKAGGVRIESLQWNIDHYTERGAEWAIVDTTFQTGVVMMTASEILELCGTDDPAVAIKILEEADAKTRSKWSSLAPPSHLDLRYESISYGVPTPALVLLLEQRAANQKATS